MAQSTVRVEERTFSMTPLGPVNPLPAVGSPLESPYRIAGEVPQEIIDGSKYGNPATLYPYQTQDNYDRTLVRTPLKTVVLENDRLRAVFLPELGGRLWELFDKRSGKQLLHTTDTIQLANLALRNAWFAGGIEWNIGTRGHSPTTCSPLHTALVRTPTGHDILRMWEYDRLREVVFQVDAWLPDDSPVLMVAIRIRNPNAVDVPMYWWTNAAVPESVDSRVIAPANSAFASNYDGGISRVTPTSDLGVDCTWPTRSPRARDFFFDLPESQRPWILTSDSDGDGLAMLSTPRLRGRKLFVWGQGDGGQHWQEWLGATAQSCDAVKSSDTAPSSAAAQSSDAEQSGSGPYAEIQAGLAQTQFQHLRMPAGAEWSWLEAYGNAAVDPAIAHGEDWTAAITHCGTRTEELAGAALLEATLATMLSHADLSPYEHVLSGNGWGALEAARRQRNGMGWVDETGTPFDAATITRDQRPWLQLLSDARFDGAHSFVRGDDWEASLATVSQSVHTLLHRAVLQHAGGDLDAAEALYRSIVESCALTQHHEHPEHSEPAALAHRGLALIAQNRHHRDAMVEHFGHASHLLPGTTELGTALRIEAATALLAHGMAKDAAELIGATASTTNGRLQFLNAQALARSGHPDRAAAILKAGVVVADLREGDDSLSALWQEVCHGEPVPPAYQFSMN